MKCYNPIMQERKYRVIEWSVSEFGRKFTQKSDLLGFFFREGDAAPVTAFMSDYEKVVKALKERREQLKALRGPGTMVFHIESNFDDFEKE